MFSLTARITFTEELLATQPADHNIHETYIASNAPDAKSKEEEIAAMGIDKVIEMASTIFPRNKLDIPFMWDYQWKGYFKSVASAFNRENKKHLPAFKKVIDTTVFVNPRQCLLILPKNGKMGTCQRPLRAQTAQGERIALARSETVPIDTTTLIEIVTLSENTLKLVRQWLDYGIYHGHGQWRNSGKGRFEWKEVTV